MKLTLPSKTYWCAWLIAGVYNFMQVGFGPQWTKAIVFSSAHFGTWAVLGLLAMPLMRRYPLGCHPGPWILHVVLGAVFTQIDITVGHLIVRAVTGAYRELGLWQLASVAFSSCFQLGLLTYWGFLGIVQGYDMQQVARQRQMQLAEQKTALVRAQLQSLNNQLQPHFLFNTLHAISSLMHYDVATAERMVTRLSELLRLALKEGRGPLVRLRKEMQFVQAYLDIEKIRFEERLNVTWQVPDSLLDHLIPPFILQPLVENAVKYGVAPYAAGGALILRVYIAQQQLVLEVKNDTPAKPVLGKGFGIGLANTRERLEALYGEQVRFELEHGDACTVARIRIPQARAELPVEEELAHA